MMVVLTVIALVGGVLFGVWLAVAAVGAWSQTDRGQRQLAIARADQRIRDAQVAAFTHMAEVAETAVHEATGAASPQGWPSDEPDQVVDGQLVPSPRRSA